VVCGVKERISYQDETPLLSQVLLIFPDHGAKEMGKGMEIENKKRCRIEIKRDGS